MKSLQHPNIIELLQVIETKENVYMVMEYAGGEELTSHICETNGPTGGGGQNILADHLCHTILP